MTVNQWKLLGQGSYKRQRVGSEERESSVHFGQRVRMEVPYEEISDEPVRGSKRNRPQKVR